MPDYEDPYGHPNDPDEDQIDATTPSTAPIAAESAPEPPSEPKPIAARAAFRRHGGPGAAWYRTTSWTRGSHLSSRRPSVRPTFRAAARAISPAA